MGIALLTLCEAMHPDGMVSTINNAESALPFTTNMPSRACEWQRLYPSLVRHRSMYKTLAFAQPNEVPRINMPI